MTDAPQEITVMDLRDGDTLVDKNEGHWLVQGYTAGETGAGFWLADPNTKIKMHLISKTHDEKVRVIRVPNHKDRLDALTAEFDDAGAGAICGVDEPLTVDEVAKSLGAEIVVEVTAAEVDEATAATPAAPVISVPFQEMTPLEMRSHLYLLHTFHATDMTSVADLVKAHDEIHAGKVKAKTLPHVHE